MRVRYSLSALVFQASATQPAITAVITAVFAFQFPGREYQPPDGDQTCFGYLQPREIQYVDAQAETMTVGGDGAEGESVTGFCRRHPISSLAGVPP